jgi:hypothetical protein
VSTMRPLLVVRRTSLIRGRKIDLASKCECVHS